MREIEAARITSAVAQLAVETNCRIGDDVIAGLTRALAVEESPTGKDILRQILENDRIAREGMVAACQDTGTAVVFVELGNDVHVTGSTLAEAIQQGVRQGYREGYLRKSIVADPFRRVNTKDNTPAIIHIEPVPGEVFALTVAPKGGGAENMSEVRMFSPSAGIEGVKKFVVDRVLRSGANPCPPILVGVGVGGNFEQVAYLAKKSLLRDVGSRHPDPFYAEMEQDLLERVNRLGIGPQGLGGRVTALAVFVTAAPCHIASLPAAVNINCHAARHQRVTL